jgi:hypothetical protein
MRRRGRTRTRTVVPHDHAAMRSLGAIAIAYGESAVETLAGGGALRVLDGSVITGGAVGIGAASQPAIDGQAVVLLAPGAQLNGGPLGPLVSVTPQSMPSLTAASAAPGGTLTVTLRATTASLFAVVIARPGPAVPLPGIQGLWLDPATAVVDAITIGPTPAAGFVVSKPVPNVAALRGFELVWQAVELPAVGGLQLSNAAPAIVH